MAGDRNARVLNIVLPLVLTLAVALPGFEPAHAQPYPYRPVRMVIGSAPGSGNDIAGRIVIAKMSEALGQQIVMENRPGANQAIAAEIVARAPADGYTLLLCGTVTVAINPALYKKLRYDPQRDFAPVALIGTVPNVLVVHPSTPVASVGEFIAYAKASPGKYSFGSSGIGSTLHLAMEMLASTTGIKLIHVPYKGGALAMADLLGGHLLAIFENVPVGAPSVRAGKVRALGVTAARRSAQLPDVPTFIEAGFPGFEIYAWYGVCAPSATPKAVVTRLNDEVNKALNQPVLQSRFADLGVDIAPGSSAQFAAFIKSEMIRWTKVIKDSGATAD
jgi:tripartite-type tricarboxylate transporter receptor subunit TctC